MAESTCMIPYYPYHNGTNPLHSEGSDSQTLSYLKQGTLYDSDRKEEFEYTISEWLEGILLKERKQGNVAIVIVPGHSPESPPNFLHAIVDDIISKTTITKTVLQRISKVPKATSTGIRCQALHEQTIAVTDPESVVDKVVYIIDDIETSGATLRACRILMMDAGAAQVKLLAVGKTDS